MIGLPLLVALLGGEAPASSAENIERFLKLAEIVATEPVGQGITAALRVELRDGEIQRPAIFKAVETGHEFGFLYGTEMARVYRDSSRHEIAAYEIDKLIGLGLIPPVVEREIDGVAGSLQMWVEDKWRRFVEGQPPPDRRRADDDVHATRLLDYLIFNTDRHFRNLIFGPGWRPIVIDHSIGFHAMKVPFRPLYRFPRQPIERLRSLDGRQIRKALGPYLSKEQIKWVERRRKVVLDLVEASVERSGASVALFDWDPP